MADTVRNEGTSVWLPSATTARRIAACFVSMAAVSNFATISTARISRKASAQMGPPLARQWAMNPLDQSHHKRLSLEISSTSSSHGFNNRLKILKG
eukprot:2024576-Pyramimonas_sp.AAC.1